MDSVKKDDDNGAKEHGSAGYTPIVLQKIINYYIINKFNDVSPRNERHI